MPTVAAAEPRLLGRRDLVAVAVQPKLAELGRSEDVDQPARPRVVHPAPALDGRPPAEQRRDLGVQGVARQLGVRRSRRGEVAQLLVDRVVHERRRPPQLVQLHRLLRRVEDRRAPASVSATVIGATAAGPHRDVSCRETASPSRLIPSLVWPRWAERPRSAPPRQGSSGQARSRDDHADKPWQRRSEAREATDAARRSCSRSFADMPETRERSHPRHDPPPHRRTTRGRIIVRRRREPLPRHRLAAAFEAFDAFPALSQSRDRLLALLADEEPSKADVVAAIESDIALTIRVMREANRDNGRIDSVVEGCRGALPRDARGGSPSACRRSTSSAARPTAIAGRSSCACTPSRRSARPTGWHARRATSTATG